MRLRNKETGVIGEVGYISTSTGDILVSNIHDQEEWYHYKSLAELNAKWEDVTEEKPKRINEIDIVLDAIGEYCSEHSYYSGGTEKIKILDTVKEKLKAWKRLKDKGFRFIDNKIIGEYGNVTYTLNYPATAIEEKDLDLLFGGEE